MAALNPVFFTPFCHVCRISTPGVLRDNMRPRVLDAKHFPYEPIQLFERHLAIDRQFDGLRGDEDDETADSPGPLQLDSLVADTNGPSVVLLIMGLR
jgi:hypothetical protein